MKEFITVRNVFFVFSAICMAVGFLGKTGEPWVSLIAIGGVVYTMAVIGPIINEISEQ